jgi:hypothetical protein
MGFGEGNQKETALADDFQSIALAGNMGRQHNSKALQYPKRMCLAKAAKLAIFIQLFSAT